MTSFAALGSTSFVVRTGVGFYRLSLPAMPTNATGSHGGAWHAVLRIGRRGGWNNPSYVPAAGVTSGGLIRYNFLAHCYSNLVFSARAVQSSYEPGADVRLFATLKEYDVPVEANRANVWAEVTRPDARTLVISLPMIEEQFNGVLTTTIPGVYVIRVRARGETFYGTPFTREQTLTAVVYPGGDRPPTTVPGDSIGELLRCVLRSSRLSDQFRKHLESIGLNPNHVMECLARYCRRTPAQIERGQTQQQIQITPALTVSAFDNIVALLRREMGIDES